MVGHGVEEIDVAKEKCQQKAHSSRNCVQGQEKADLNSTGKMTCIIFYLIFQVASSY